MLHRIPRRGFRHQQAWRLNPKQERVYDAAVSIAGISDAVSSLFVAADGSRGRGVGSSTSAARRRLGMHLLSWEVEAISAKFWSSGTDRSDASSEVPYATDCLESTESASSTGFDYELRNSVRDEDGSRP